MTKRYRQPVQEIHQAIPKWGEWIDVSFLPNEMKGKYKALIAEKNRAIKIAALHLAAKIISSKNNCRIFTTKQATDNPNNITSK